MLRQFDTVEKTRATTWCVSVWVAQGRKVYGARESVQLGEAFIAGAAKVSGCVCVCELVRSSFRSELKVGDDYEEAFKGKMLK